MTNTAIRQKLHNYLELVDDRKLEAIYTIMEIEIEESSVTYTDEFKSELNERFAQYKSGNIVMIDAMESNKRIQAILKTGTK